MVLDASALVEVILNTELGQPIRARWSELGDAQAPHLATTEVVSVLRRLVSNETISPGRGLRAVGHLETLPYERRAHEPLLGRMWALRVNLTAYDAAYVALAEAFAAPLLTCDAKLAGAPGNEAAVELFEM